MLRRLNEFMLVSSPRLSRSRWIQAARRVLTVLRRWRSALFSRYDYRIWRTRNEPDADELKAQRKHPSARGLKQFIVVQALPGASLEQCQAWVKRLERQTYSGWKAWLGIPSPSMQPMQQWLAEAETSPGRIHLYALESPEQSAPELHAGDYFLPLDPDMLLSPDALWQLAQFASLHPDVAWIYSDQDLLDVAGRRDPWFKPDWSPELLWSVDYVLPAAICAQDMAGLPAYLPDADGWWDRTRLLALLPQDGSCIGHVPRILFHRLAHANHLPDLPARQARQRFAHVEWIKTRLDSSGESHPQVERDASGWPHIAWDRDEIPVSIVIASAGDPGLLGRCLRSLVDTTDYAAYEARIVVAAGTANRIRSLTKLDEARVSVIENPADLFNYSGANNLGAASAMGELLLFLNDDMEAYQPGWLAEMSGWAQQAGVGVVGAKLRYPNGAIQHYGVVIGMGGHAAHAFQGGRDSDRGLFGSTSWYRDVSAVTGACLMINRKLFDELGGFDESYELVYSDIDLCLRALEHGERVMVTPFAELIHHEGRSRGFHMPAADMQRAMECFLPRIRTGDPYFNPNLSYLSALPQLKLHDEDRVARVRQVVERAMHK